MVLDKAKFNSEYKKYRDVIEKKHFSTVKWRMSEEQWDLFHKNAIGMRIFRHHMIESVNLLSFLYEKFDETKDSKEVEELKEAIVTAWRYYIVISETQNRHLEFIRARKDLEIGEIKEKFKYPAVYVSKNLIRYDGESLT